MRAIAHARSSIEPVVSALAIPAVATSSRVQLPGLVAQTPLPPPPSQRRGCSSTPIARYAHRSTFPQRSTQGSMSVPFNRPPIPRRSYATGPTTSTSAAPASYPTLLSAPSSPEEPNVYKQSSTPSILLTERAVKHLHKVAKKEKDKGKRLALRIAVEPGGCHGYQYKMELEEPEEGQQEPGEEDDFRFQPNYPTSEIQPIPVLIDSVSLTLLQGSTIDYVTELIGSQFAIKDNPQAKGAGCGCGISWEPNL